MIVHRNLRKYLFNKDRFFNQDTIVKLDEIAKQTSETERVAMNAEREILDIKKAENMEKQNNEEYFRVISSVLKFGMFVKLPNTIEGLFHVSTLDDYYAYDENNLTLKAESSNKEYHIGQEVKVKVTKVNRLLGKIDFVIVKE